MAQIATLHEIERHWSLDDLITGNLSLSVHLAMMRRA